MQFEWDEAKAAANIKKHGESFFETIEVLKDPLALTVYDDEHSNFEDRFVTIGSSATRQVVVVVHADRNDVVRIISARLANRRERLDYEDGTLP